MAASTHSGGWINQTTFLRRFHDGPDGGHIKNRHITFKSPALGALFLK